MIDQLISFETAKLAKEKGFDIDLTVLQPKLPTQSLLQKWLREQHNINFRLYEPNIDNKYKWICFSSGKLGIQRKTEGDTYEEALEQGLKESLLLINYKKQFSDFPTTMRKIALIESELSALESEPDKAEDNQRKAYIRKQALSVIELTKGFTTTPTDNAMVTLLEFTNYILELTNSEPQKEAEERKTAEQNINELIEVYNPPYFRKMVVESGFLYNFYDCQKDEYLSEWIFVPNFASQSLPEITDEEIAKEAEQRFGEVMGGQFHAKRPHDMSVFRKGAKWYRDELKRRLK